MRAPLGIISSIVLLAMAMACGNSDPTNVEDEDPGPGQTTPSSIPDGDYPPIPEPTSTTGTDAGASDTTTTIAPLATHFRPPLRSITGAWSVGQAYAGQLQKTNTIRSCFYTVFSGRASSDDIVFRSKRVDCPIAEGGTWAYVEYPSRGRYMQSWLRTRNDGDGYRRVLVRDGDVVPGRTTEVLLDEFDGSPFGQYVGDRTLAGARYGCLLDGTGVVGAVPCRWHIIANASVTREPLASLPHIRRDVYWVKVGPSEIVGNSQNVESTWTIERTWKEGTAQAETEQFGRTVAVEAGLSYQGLGAKASQTLSETFGSSVTVTEETEVSKTFTMTVRANTTAVFELWNLTERYRFVNEDGTPFEDPSYRFEVTDLTRKATIATAWTSTEFPNSN